MRSAHTSCVELLCGGGQDDSDATNTYGREKQGLESVSQRKERKNESPVLAVQHSPAHAAHEVRLVAKVVYISMAVVSTCTQVRQVSKSSHQSHSSQTSKSHH